MKKSSDSTRKSDKEESVDLSDMSQLEGHVEVKEKKLLKNFSIKKFFSIASTYKVWKQFIQIKK